MTLMIFSRTNGRAYATVLWIPKPRISARPRPAHTRIPCPPSRRRHHHPQHQAPHPTLRPNPKGQSRC